MFYKRVDKVKEQDYLETLVDVGFFKAYKEEIDKNLRRVIPKEKSD